MYTDTRYLFTRMPYWSPVVSRSFRCESRSHTGIRRFDGRTTKRGQVRPTTATFSFYANFVNTLFSRLSYFADMPFYICTVLSRCRTGRWTENEIFPAKGDNRETVYCSCYYVKTYRSISESLMNLMMITRMVRTWARIYYYSTIKKKKILGPWSKNNLEIFYIFVRTLFAILHLRLTYDKYIYIYI